MCIRDSVQPARADLSREQRSARARRGAAVDRQDPDRRGRRVPRDGAAPGDRQPARGRVLRALTDGQRRRDPDPAPAPRDRDHAAGARHARRAAAQALTLTRCWPCRRMPRCRRPRARATLALMFDAESGSVAVDPPIRFVAPTSRRRRHRSLTGLSGILLFACVFLPAVKGCNHPVMPYEFPPFLPPYLYGLVFAAIAMAGSPRGVMCGVLAVRVLATLVVTGSIVLFVVAPPVGAIELMIGTMLFAIVGLCLLYTSDAADERSSVDL